jgi:hypothetical protein
MTFGFTLKEERPQVNAVVRAAAVIELDLIKVEEIPNIVTKQKNERFRPTIRTRYGD